MDEALRALTLSHQGLSEATMSGLRFDPGSLPEGIAGVRRLEGLEVQVQFVLSSVALPEKGPFSKALMPTGDEVEVVAVCKCLRHRTGARPCRGCPGCRAGSEPGDARPGLRAGAAGGPLTLLRSCGSGNGGPPPALALLARCGVSLRAHAAESGEDDRPPQAPQPRVPVEPRKFGNRSP